MEYLKLSSNSTGIMFMEYLKLSSYSTGIMFMEYLKLSSYSTGLMFMEYLKLSSYSRGLKGSIVVIQIMTSPWKVDPIVYIYLLCSRMTHKLGYIVSMSDVAQYEHFVKICSCSEHWIRWKSFLSRIGDNSTLWDTTFCRGCI